MGEAHLRTAKFVPQRLHDAHHVPTHRVAALV